MIYWLIGSIGLFLLNFIYGVFYFLQTQFLIKKTLAYPDINAEIGSPRSIADIGKRHNFECYEAFQSFVDSKRYLDADIPEPLKNRFVKLEKTKRNGLRFTVITISNFVLCIIVLTLLYSCDLS
jgi:hypothetical protein